jgi:hypothetical protein
MLRPSHPAPRFVTIGRNAPPMARDGGKIQLMRASEKKKFLSKRLIRQIGLK